MDADLYINDIPTPPFSVKRRQADQALLVLVKEILANQHKMDAKLEQHMSDEMRDIAAEVAKLIAAAFPAGDPDGHRKHHEIVIKQAEKRAAFWAKMLEELTKWGLVGFAGWAVYALWEAFLKGPHK